MRSRAEVTSRYAKAYVQALKKSRGRIFDQVVDLTASHVITRGAGLSQRPSYRRGWAAVLPSGGANRVR